MSKFTVEFKEAVLTRLVTGDFSSITELSNHYNLSKSTLYNWKAEAQSNANGNDIAKTKRARIFSEKSKSGIPINKLNDAQKKLNIIIATATLNEAELARYCRENGLETDTVKALLNECEKPWLKKKCIQ